MIGILCFDISALLILTVLIFSFEFGKMGRDKNTRQLEILIAVTMLAAVFNISANVSNGTSAAYNGIRYACLGMYHIARCVSYYLYCKYIISITETDHKIDDWLLMIVQYIPIIVVSYLVCMAPYNDFLYQYDAYGMYVRGYGYSTLYVLNTPYILYALYFIIKNASIDGFKRTVSLASCSVFSIVTSVIQYQVPFYVVDILGFTLSLLFIVLFIDNPDDKIEKVSSFLSYGAYAKDIKRVFFARKKTDIIHLNIQNFRFIEQMLSYDGQCEMIRIVSRELESIVFSKRADARLYYLKDGRFRIVLTDYNLDRTRELSKSVLSYFNSEIMVKDMEIQLESSISISQCPKDFATFDEFIEFANTARNYEKAGKIHYSSEVIRNDKYSVSSITDKLIEKGLVDNNFRVYYQPIFNVKEGRFDSAEALLRLVDETYGIILPEVFIPVAEQNGSINKLGLFVIEEVCKFIASDDFKKAGLAHVGINLSVFQCLQRNLSEQIFEIIDRYRVDHSIITFEITESLASDNQKAFTENINRLSVRDIELALDNYGTGYSNIITLTTLPVSYVKFDKSFVNTKGNERLRDILNTSIDMVKSLGKEIVVMGVEDEEEAKRFMESGIEYIQGFCYSKPLPQTVFIKFCENSMIGTNDALR